MSMLGMEIAADLSVNGATAGIASLNNVAQAADRASSAFDKIGARSAHALTSLGHHASGAANAITAMATGAATAVAGLAGAKGFGLLRNGVAHINNELEKTQIGFATVFRLFGASSNMNEGLEMSRGLMADLRKDAASLPGEFQDFASMAQTLTNPLLQAGKGVKEIRDLTRQTVVAAANAGVNFGVASHEMSAALGGRVSSAMPLMRYLGIHHNTQIDRKGGGKVDFSKATYGERYDFLHKMLEKADEALPLFKRSWEGMTTSISDNWSSVVGTVTGPLFARMKSTMWSLVGDGGLWDKHKDKVMATAESVGITLGNAWLRFEGYIARTPYYLAKIRDHWIEIREQAAGALHKIESVFQKLQPMMGGAARFIGHELAHPAQAMTHVLGLRMGGAAMSMGGNMLGPLMQLHAARAGKATQVAVKEGTKEALADVGKLGIRGGAAHEADVMARLATGGGLFGAGAPTGMGAVAAGEGEALAAGGAAAGAGVAVVAIAALVAVLAGGIAIFDNVANSAQIATMWVSDITSSLSGLWGSIAGEGTLMRDILGGIGAVIVRLVDNQLQPMLMVVHGVTDALNWLNGQWNDLKTSLGFVQNDFQTVTNDGRLMAEAFDMLAIALTGAMNPMGAFIKILKKMGVISDDFTPGTEPIDHSTSVSWGANAMGGVKAAYMGEKPKVEAAHHVDARGSKIEIKLDARGETPDRIARKLFDAMGKALTRPMTSTYAPAKGY